MPRSCWCPRPAAPACGPGSDATSPRADRSTTDPEEIELKLTVLDITAIQALVLDPAAWLPGVAPLGPPRSLEIEDRYLDTSRGSLRSAGLVARIRTGPGARRLTLKSLARRGEGAVHRRLELEGDAGHGDDPRTWPASEARERFLDAAGADPLETLAVIRQHRFQRDVAVGASVVELSLDEIEVAGATGGHDGWVELEAELRSGSEKDLAALGAELLRRADLAPATTSKLRRALAAVDPLR